MSRLPKVIFVLVIFSFTLTNLVLFLSSKIKTVTPVVLGAESTNYNVDLISYWESFVEKHPTYRDGYLELAHAYKAQGMNDKSKHYLELARILDPNNLEILNTYQELGF